MLERGSYKYPIAEFGALYYNGWKIESGFAVGPELGASRQGGIKKSCLPRAYLLLSNIYFLSNVSLLRI